MPDIWKKHCENLMEIERRCRERQAFLSRFWIWRPYSKYNLSEQELYEQGYENLGHICKQKESAIIRPARFGDIILRPVYTMPRPRTPNAPEKSVLSLLCLMVVPIYCLRGEMYLETNPLVKVGKK